MRSPLPIIVAALLACGGSDPTQPTVSPPTSSPAPTTPASPEPASAPGPAGSPQPDPAASATLELERLDAAAECDGLLPAQIPHPPLTIDLPGDDAAACGGGSSDGTGHVAVGDGRGWRVFAPDGSPGEAVAASRLVPQASGWHALTVRPLPEADGGSVIGQATLAPDGSPLRGTTVSLDPALVLTGRADLAVDPAGGSLVLLTDLDRGHNHWSSVRAQRFDAAGAPRWPAPVRLASRSDPVLFLAAGVSREGEALALWQRSAYLDLAWLDAAGATVASAELTERAADVLGTDALSPALELVPLLDGSVAVRADGSFRRIYPRLATTSAPLPAWLAERAGWSLRFTRGNRGYALLPPAGQAAPGCAQAVELRAPSGRLCGQVVIRPAAAGACVTGVVDQGWDGTLVQQVARDACSWRVWPGLLGR